MNEVLFEKQDHVARIKLNRPEALNAFNPALSNLLWQYIGEAVGDDDVRVIILSGEGRCFSAGADLKWLVHQPQTDPDAVLMSRSTGRGWHSFWGIQKPIITQVHGYCVAGACECVFFSDYTVASDDATFGEPETRNAWVLPGMFLLGPKIGRELLLFGDMVSASDALRMGLINRVVPRDQLEQAAFEAAEKLVHIPRAALALVKRTGARLYQGMGFDSTQQSASELMAYIRAVQAVNDDETGFRALVKERGLKEALKARDIR